MSWYMKLSDAYPFVGVFFLALVLAVYAWLEHWKAQRQARAPEPEDIIESDPEYFAFAAGLIANDLVIDWEPEEVYRLHRVYLRGLNEVALLCEQKSDDLPGGEDLQTRAW